VIEERAAVLDHLEEDLLHWLLSQRRVAVEIADESVYTRGSFPTVAN
jgi:hypothetical protein